MMKLRDDYGELLGLSDVKRIMYLWNVYLIVISN